MLTFWSFRPNEGETSEERPLHYLERSFKWKTNTSLTEWPYTALSWDGWMDGWMDGWSEWKVPNVDSGIFLNLNALQTSGQYSDCFDGKVFSSKHCHHTFRTLFGLISLKLCSPCQGLTPPKRLDFQFISFNGGRNHSPIKQARKARRCDSYLQIWNYHPLQCTDWLTGVGARRGFPSLYENKSENQDSDGERKKPSLIGTYLGWEVKGKTRQIPLPNQRIKHVQRKPLQSLNLCPTES